MGLSLQTSSSPTLPDRVKVSCLVAMRKSHRRVLEQKSRTTFRRRRVPTSPAPRLVPAARKYTDIGWLPASLLVPERLPPEAHLPLRYKVPYYAVGKLGWLLYGRAPVDPALPWSPDSRWTALFDSSVPAWGPPAADETFVRLRLQGPNPFMLTKVEPDPTQGDVAADLYFDLDFSKLFAGICEPVVARFVVRDGALQPAWISVGPLTHRPGDSGWDDAKRVVNGLDARCAAFVRHLLNTHLMVGEAYAVAAATLPVWHPLRPFMDFFTYGTLEVNHFAYDGLLTANSYFIRSNFLSFSDVNKLMNNAAELFDFDDWHVPRDLARRQIEQIPDHPYAADARLIWPTFEAVVTALPRRARLRRQRGRRRPPPRRVVPGATRRPPGE